MTLGPPTPKAVETFLKLARAKAVEMVLNYKALLLERGLAEHPSVKNLSISASLKIQA